jgi:DNA-binding transcriptional regulator GbsR (MarR family)
MALAVQKVQYILNAMDRVAVSVPAGVADPADVEAFVEEIARYFEEAGWPRMAGRLLGALLVAEPREQSAADLAHRLRASRGSISTMSRLLVSVDLVERRTRRGDRREYLRFRDDAWPKVLADKTRWMSDLRRIGERGLDLYIETDGPARESLQELVDMMEFFEREWPPLMERWLAERAARKGTAGA